MVRVPLAALADPANRLRVRHPSGYVGPAFVVAGLLVWGFTGGILSALLDLGGWARPWDTNRTLGLGEAWAQRAGRSAGGRGVMEAVGGGPLPCPGHGRGPGLPT